MAKATRTVSIDLDQYQQLKEFSEASGISLEILIHRALEDWIECSLPAEYHALQAKLAV